MGHVFDNPSCLIEAVYIVCYFAPDLDVKSSQLIENSHDCESHDSDSVESVERQPFMSSNDGARDVQMLGLLFDKPFPRS